MSDYKVEIDGSVFIVAQDGKEVMGPFTEKYRAEDVCDQLNRKAQMIERPCITCSEEFLSEGAHNRMCNSCRSAASDMGMVA